MLLFLHNTKPNTHFNLFLELSYVHIQISHDNISKLRPFSFCLVNQNFGFQPKTVEFCIQFTLSSVKILVEDQNNYCKVIQSCVLMANRVHKKNVPSDLFPFHCGVIEKIPFEVIGSSSNLLVTVEKSKDPKLLLVFREMKLAGCSFKIDDH